MHLTIRNREFYVYVDTDAFDPNRWYVATENGLSSRHNWYTVNVAQKRTIRSGPAKMRGLNYYDRAKERADAFNASPSHNPVV